MYIYTHNFSTFFSQYRKEKLHETRNFPMHCFFHIFSTVCCGKHFSPEKLIFVRFCSKYLHIFFIFSGICFQKAVEICCWKIHQQVSFQQHGRFPNEDFPKNSVSHRSFQQVSIPPPLLFFGIKYSSDFSPLFFPFFSAEKFSTSNCGKLATNGNCVKTVSPKHDKRQKQCFRSRNKKNPHSTFQQVCVENFGYKKFYLKCAVGRDRWGTFSQISSPTPLQKTGTFWRITFRLRHRSVPLLLSVSDAEPCRFYFPTQNRAGSTFRRRTGERFRWRFLRWCRGRLSHWERLPPPPLRCKLRRSLLRWQEHRMLP